MQEGILRCGDIRGQGAEGTARRWGRLLARSHGLTVQLSNNVFCYLLRNELALELSEAKRTKGINSPGALVCVPGNRQRQAPRWMTRSRLQSRPLSRATGEVVQPKGCGVHPLQSGPGLSRGLDFSLPSGSCVSDISCFQVFVRSAWFLFKICSPWFGAKF